MALGTALIHGLRLTPTGERPYIITSNGYRTDITQLLTCEHPDEFKPYHGSKLIGFDHEISLIDLVGGGVEARIIGARIHSEVQPVDTAIKVCDSSRIRNAQRWELLEALMNAQAQGDPVATKLIQIFGLYRDDRALLILQARHPLTLRQVIGPRKLHQRFQNQKPPGRVERMFLGEVLKALDLESPHIDIKRSSRAIKKDSTTFQIALGRAVIKSLEHLTSFCRAHFPAAQGPFLSHRDFKPENILIAGAFPVTGDINRRKGFRPEQLIAAHAIDFGLAHIFTEGTKPVSDFFMNEGPYISPRKAQDPIGDPYIDIYGLGLILYEILTHHAAIGSYLDWNNEALQSGRVPLIRIENTPWPKELPVGLQRVIQRCVAPSGYEIYDPETTGSIAQMRRYESAAEVLAAYDAALV